MKIFSWVQRKLSGNGGGGGNQPSSKNHHLMHGGGAASKEEFIDWPNGLLAIGTFGNSSLKEKDPEITHGEDDDHPAEEITPEELKELQKELKLISNKHSDFTEESPKHSLPAEKFFDFLKTLEGDRSGDLPVQGSTAAVCGTGKDDHLLNKKENISQKSVTFLLRKVFDRIRKFRFTQQLGDPMRELKLEKSRLEKILRAILKKKVYPQSGSPQARANKILDQKHPSATETDEEAAEGTSEGSKWVKTDSDFIVLEI